MSMQQARRQMPAIAGRAGVVHGEAGREPASDEASCPRQDTESTGSALLQAALTRENLRRAWKRVKANRGAAGVDGLDIDQTTRHLVTAWPGIRDQLLRGTYRPSPVRRVTSAVASVTGRKFLGYSFWYAKKGEVKRKVAAKPLAMFKQRVRQQTRRSGGRSLAQIIERLRPYLLGWKAYFGLAQTPGIWRKLDEWLRHRLRAIELKHWKRGKTMYRELLKLGATEDVAQRVAANSHRWWCNSDGYINRVLTIAYFDRLGVPRLS